MMENLLSMTLLSICISLQAHRLRVCNVFSSESDHLKNLNMG